MVQPTPYTETDFIEAVRSSLTMAQVLRVLGLKATGGNYTTAKVKIKKLQLDTTHWTGQGHMKGGTHKRSKKIPLTAILVENSLYSNTQSLKVQLVREGFLAYQCKVCGLTEWLGAPLSLQLDHINGSHDDNRIDNLRLLCPNCHSQTPTFAGRKLKLPPRFCELCQKVAVSKKSRHCGPCSVKTKVATWKGLVCPNCDKIKSPHSACCHDCNSSRRMMMGPTVIVWPSIEELLAQLRKSSFMAVAKSLGVSDNAVRKHLLRRGVTNLPDGRAKKLGVR